VSQSELLASHPAGVRLHAEPQLLVLQAERPLEFASTAVLGGGRRSGRTVVSLRVPESYSGDDPQRDIRQAAASFGVTADVGLMTAVSLDRRVCRVQQLAGLTAWVIATVGVVWPYAAGGRVEPGGDAAAAYDPGTINLIALLDACMSEAAALNLLITLTEAKTLALLEFDLRDRAGNRASGTASDAVVVGWWPAGPAQQFGGPASAAGHAAGYAARQAVRAGLVGL